MFENITAINYKTEIEKLHFHDSEIESLTMDANRRCELVINYYNWEGNKENSDKWEWKKLRINFAFIAVFEWNAPDLLNRYSAILETKYDEGIEKLYQIEMNRKQKYCKYESPLFDKASNYLSITFYISNFDEGLREDYGYLRLIGADVSIEWLEDSHFRGQIHIPIRKDRFTNIMKNALKNKQE